MDSNEHELVQFLTMAHTEQLRTWQRQRTCEELRSFVVRRLELLDDEGVELTT